MTESDPEARAAPRAMVAVVASLVVWSGWLIYRSSFVVDGVRFFSLFDDAMISMVYAKNVVEGFGLNWARWGDPVEGFTCPLWTFALIPVNALPLPLPLRSLVVQIASLALLVANLFAVRRLALDHFTAPGARHALPAVVLTAAYYPLNHWSLMGMETALQALLIVMAVRLTLDAVHGGAQRSTPLGAHGGAQRFTALGAVFALAILLRPDMALPVGACLVYLFPTLRRAPARAWLPGALLLFGAGIGYEAFRLVYFGDPLPNTYYLKMTGTPMSVRVAHGVAVFVEFARPILLVLIAVGLGAFGLRRSRPQVRLPLAIVGLCFAYSIYIGGDVYDFFAAANRFVAPVMPLVFVLFGACLCESLARAPQAWRPVGRARGYALAGVTIAAALSFNGLLELQVRKQWLAYLGIERPLFVEKHPGLVARTQRLAEILEPDALVATSWAGLPPYFARFRWVDFLGYNERTIAKRPAYRTLSLDEQERFDPGHMKWDVAYIVDEMRPDAIYLNGSMEPHLRQGAPDYELVEGVYWLRRGSEKVRWDAVARE